MALPSLATADELVTWMGDTELNEDRAEAILAAASTLIRVHTGRVWVDDDGPEDVDEIKLEAARTVCLTVAERVYNNPKGVTQEAAGPFSRTIAAWAALGLALTDDEKGMLTTSSQGIPGLSSVRVVAPAHASGVPRMSAWWDEDEVELGS